jgi:hypothetical protein
LILGYSPYRDPWDTKAMAAASIVLAGTAREFSAAEGLHPSTLSWVSSAIKREMPRAQFIEVVVQAVRPPWAAGIIEVPIRDRLRLHEEGGAVLAPALAPEKFVLHFRAPFPPTNSSRNPMILHRAPPAPFATRGPRGAILETPRTSRRRAVQIRQALLPARTGACVLSLRRTPVPRRRPSRL